MRTIHDTTRESGVHGVVFFTFLCTTAWPLLALPARQTLTAFFAYLLAIWCLMIVSLWLLARRAIDESTDPATDRPTDEWNDVEEPGGISRV